MLAIITKIEAFTSKKGNQLLSLHTVDMRGAVDKVIIKDDSKAAEGNGFEYQITELPEQGQVTPIWHSIEFDRKGYCQGIRIL